MSYSKLNIRVIKALFNSQYANMLEYRVEIALWALSGVLPFIMLSIWKESGAAISYGFDGISLSRYFLSAFLVRQFSVVWVVFSFEEDALLGKLSPYLIQPLHPLWRYFASHIAEQVTRLPFALLITFTFFFFNPDSFWIPSLMVFLLAWLSTIFAFLIAFLLQSIIASLCFWNEKASSLERLLFTTYLFLSGLLAPISSFPPNIQKIVLLTPFPYMISFPANILSGLAENIFIGFIIQITWISILLPVVILLWKAGVRKYTAMGA